MRRLALKSALSTNVAAGNLIVLEELKLSEIKTKRMVQVLNNLGVNKSALLVMTERDEKIERSCSNLQGVKTALVNTINVYDILKFDKFIVTKDAVAKVEEVYA